MFVDPPFRCILAERRLCRFLRTSVEFVFVACFTCIADVELQRQILLPTSRDVA